MTCKCGDLYCSSCGPAQGNSYCPACGHWTADGGCEDPEKCQRECREQDRLYIRSEVERELEEATLFGRPPKVWAAAEHLASTMAEAIKGDDTVSPFDVAAALVLCENHLTSGDERINAMRKFLEPKA